MAMTSPHTHSPITHIHSTAHAKPNTSSSSSSTHNPNYIIPSLYNTLHEISLTHHTPAIHPSMHAPHPTTPPCDHKPSLAHRPTCQKVHSSCNIFFFCPLHVAIAIATFIQQRAAPPHSHSHPHPLAASSSFILLTVLLDL